MYNMLSVQGESWFYIPRRDLVLPWSGGWRSREKIVALAQRVCRGEDVFSIPAKIPLPELAKNVKENAEQVQTFIRISSEVRLENGSDLRTMLLGAASIKTQHLEHRLLFHLFMEPPTAEHPWGQTTLMLSGELQEVRNAAQHCGSCTWFGPASRGSRETYRTVDDAIDAYKCLLPE